jgi:uncharacterized protein
MEKKLSWEEIAELSRKLASIIKASGFKPDYLIGITAGGLIPLGLLAQELDIRNIVTVSATSYEGKEQKEIEITYLPIIDVSGKKLLLIDEVSETGQTLQHIANTVQEKYQPSELRTATLVVNAKESKFRPDFCALEVQEWVVFPWEVSE